MKPLLAILMVLMLAGAGLALAEPCQTPWVYWGYLEDTGTGSGGNQAHWTPAKGFDNRKDCEVFQEDVLSKNATEMKGFKAIRNVNVVTVYKESGQWLYTMNTVCLPNGTKP